MLRSNIRRRRPLTVESLEPRIVMCVAPVVSQPAIELDSYEQQMLEFVNRARANPLAEADRQGISLNQGLSAGTLGTESRPPLAPNSLLNAAAVDHTLDMIERAFFDHVNPDGDGVGDRTTSAGYESGFVGENLAARGLLTLPAAAQALHSMLFLSPGHRVNLLRAGFKEVGLGMEYGPIRFNSVQTQAGSIVTQVFGGGPTGQLYVTGVAFDDANANGIYDLGEGRRGVMVEARDDQGNRQATTTGASGGYSLRLDPGAYRVFAYSENRSRMLDLGSVNLATVNVKRDISIANLEDGLVPQDVIVLSGEGETLSMTDPQLSLVDVCRIDIRGTGSNVLEVDVGKLRDSVVNHSLTVIADQDDSIQFDAGWSFDSLRIDDGALVRRFRNDATDFDLIGPNDYTNPIDPFDVNANGGVSSSDALTIINELASRRYSLAASGLARSASSVELDGFAFFDVSEDSHVTSLDALRVINELTRRANQQLLSGEASMSATSSVAASVENGGTAEEKSGDLAIPARKTVTPLANPWQDAEPYLAISVFAGADSQANHSEPPNASELDLQDAGFRALASSDLSPVFSRRP